MPSETWSESELRHVRQRVVKKILEEGADGRVPPFVLAVACIQCARTLLRKYPAKGGKDTPTEPMLRRLCVAFLNGETKPKGVQDEGSMLWTPDQVM
jgi:hypothetical protein